ncbi:MAG TPA: TAT-variant-translocated molybdopterin oxidoreductase [Chitinophagaceae bacterium]|nr:TAT-variant-translocated molybdopterin oxidoreductase [Chitinophagaceae bacterium]
MDEKKYWQSFGELNRSDEFKKSLDNEFNEELLPLEDVKEIMDATTPRRDFLKYMGFSTAAAALAASCEVPVRKAIPFLNKRDDITPGISNYYASTYVSDGDAVPVIVKQREGRPIKIEGNTLSPLTGGGTSAQVQASVLDLYDTSRLRYPMAKGKEATFEVIDKMIADDLAGVSGKPLVLLTSSLTSPTTKQIITEFLAKYPGSRHVQYDGVSYSGMLQANEASYGKKALPSYHFENAKVIVSVGADFLGTWLSPVVFAKQYAQNRRINAERPEMSRHIQFESHLSMTGANADERYLHKPSETGAVALALLAAVGGSVTSNLTGNAAEGVKKAAAELMANKGAALVVCGSNDPNVQIIVNAINEAIGAGGKTIDWSSTANYRQGVDADFATLVNDLNAGNVGALLIYGANPAYNYFAADKFKAGLKKCPVSISFNEKMDETTELCKYILPSHHWLESWGDAEPQTGFISLQQPLIHPLFKTRQFEDSLLKWTGSKAAVGATDSTATAGKTAQAGADYQTYFKNYWTAKVGGADNFNIALQDGVIHSSSANATKQNSDSARSSSDTSGIIKTITTSLSMSGGSFGGNVADAAAKIGAIKGSDKEVVLYQKVSLGTGHNANNPWLQELPDPITKATWDNYAMISPAMGKALFNIDIFNKNHVDKYEVKPEKPVVKVTVNGRSVALPALIIPGIHPNVIALAVGYGRQSSATDKTADFIGRAANGAGVNVYPLASFNGVTVDYYATNATIEKTGDTYPVAQSQVHNVTEGRPVIRETTLAKFIANPKELNHHEEEEFKAYGEDFVKDATMYPHYDKPGMKWGMSIDLNTCTGCSACVVACHAENNIPVVGKMEVARYHDMHWLRIDRYFTGSPENPDVIFQPMLCQHCDNAPCENVCPVSATNHSSEGLNQMAYNRCIGTRYCANNCPYKVRRFNWADYTGADSFPDNQRGIISDATMMMNDDLSRMVLNPDVTVRSHGVMEKCSFCVQRLQEGKLNAKKENRTVKDGEIQTACMQACPTNAIVFSNVNDRESKVSKIRNIEQKERRFYVLEQLHTLSNVNYLAKIRNTDRMVGDLHNESHETGDFHGTKEANTEQVK